MVKQGEMNGVEVSDDGETLTFHYLCGDERVAIASPAKTLSATIAILQQADRARHVKRGREGASKGEWAEIYADAQAVPHLASEPTSQRVVILWNPGGPYECAFSLSVGEARQLVSSLLTEIEILAQSLYRA